MSNTSSQFVCSATDSSLPDPSSEIWATKKSPLFLKIAFFLIFCLQWPHFPVYCYMKLHKINHVLLSSVFINAAAKGTNNCFLKGFLYGVCFTGALVRKLFYFLKHDKAA